MSDGVLVIDLGAFSTKVALVDSMSVSKVEEVPTEGFSGYISNLEALVNTIHRAVSKLSTSVQLPSESPIPTLLAVHLKDYVQFKVANHEISVSHSSEDSKVSESQMEKLHRELEEKIRGPDNHVLFFSISRYSVLQGGVERDVENPRNLRVDILKGTAVGVVVAKSVYENLMDIFREHNGIHEEFSLEVVGIYSSPILASLASVNHGVDEHVHIDLGHTSFRVVKLLSGRVSDFAEYNVGGNSIIRSISSTLGIPPRYSFKVLEEYLKNDKRTVQIQGKTIDTNIVSNILKDTLSEFLNSEKVRRIIGHGEGVFTLSLSGGLANYDRVKEYISDEGLPEPMLLPEIYPKNFVFQGARTLVRRTHPERYSRVKNDKGKWMKRFVDFFKREVLGIEEKGG